MMSTVVVGMVVAALLIAVVTTMVWAAENQASIERPQALSEDERKRWREYERKRGRTLAMAILLVGTPQAMAGEVTIKGLGDPDTQSKQRAEAEHARRVAERQQSRRDREAEVQRILADRAKQRNDEREQLRIDREGIDRKQAKQGEEEREELLREREAIERERAEERAREEIVARDKARADYTRSYALKYRIKGVRVPDPPDAPANAADMGRYKKESEAYNKALDRAAKRIVEVEHRRARGQPSVVASRSIMADDAAAQAVALSQAAAMHRWHTQAFAPYRPYYLYTGVPVFSVPRDSFVPRATSAPISPR